MKNENYMHAKISIKALAAVLKINVKSQYLFNGWWGWTQLVDKGLRYSRLQGHGVYLSQEQRSASLPAHPPPQAQQNASDEQRLPHSRHNYSFCRREN